MALAVRFVTLVILEVLIAVPGVAQSEEVNSLVGTLRSDHGVMGCSWYATLPSEPRNTIFLAEYDLSKVYMHIDGKDRVLIMDEQRTHGDLNQLGSVLSTVFLAEGVEVSATFKATFVCPESSSSCEVAKFDAEFNVTAKAKKQSVRGSGEVGC